MRKSDLDETEPAQEKRDGKARCKDGEDKKANVVEAAEAKPGAACRVNSVFASLALLHLSGQESSAKRSRQKGALEASFSSQILWQASAGGETLKQQPRKARCYWSGHGPAMGWNALAIWRCCQEAQKARKRGKVATKAACIHWPNPLCARPHVQCPIDCMKMIEYRL